METKQGSSFSLMFTNARELLRQPPQDQQANKKTHKKYKISRSKANSLRKRCTWGPSTFGVHVGLPARKADFGPTKNISPGNTWGGKRGVHMSCVLGHVATLSRATFRKIRWFGFLDPTGDKILLGCYNRPANLSFEVSSTMGPKNYTFWTGN
ncbi:unnamed protein product [Prunus armeniaca]|uniref:Uncharacterized protein n=1 Tax=Prunus armeniaca TaxID=36596 RepID=A0A6J5Y8W3_PRUAR|nr:unnamed protein product [Prunus armeniaca]